MQLINSIGVEHAGKLIQITGTVIRCGLTKSLAIRKDFQCSSCGKQIRAEADISEYFSFDLPSSCPSKKCKFPRFEALEGTEEWLDCREIKLNDRFSGAIGGCLPQSLTVILTGNLVNSCSPGDDLTISGILFKRWKPLKKNMFIEVNLCLLASSLSVSSTDFGEAKDEEQFNLPDFDKRKQLVESFAPFIYGCDHIKLAILLSIIGGVREEVNGLKLRGHIHLLMIGESGTGKTELLREACKIQARSVYTNAIGASKAGLTLSAVKEGNDWMLEAGALVLADCGLCCLDDLSLLGKEDLSEIYESMENQTISVAKAGMVCSVNTRSTILAACRPKNNRFNFGIDLEGNSGLSSPLLSRFDLIFIMLDSPDENADNIKSRFILGNGNVTESLMSYRSLAHYLDNARSSSPTLCEDATEILEKYFKIIRSKRDTSITIRQLESLIRLSQAHARLCGREDVGVFDAVSVVLLMECTSRTAGLLTIDASMAFLDQEMFNDAMIELVYALGKTN